MKLSVKKFEQLINREKSDSKFAKNIGMTRNALYKYRNGDNYEEKDLRTDIAIEISKFYKIDFYYFYKDEIEISDNPEKDHPIVDNARVNELEESVKTLACQMSELIKNGEKTRSDNMKMLSEFANDVIGEYISTTIKTESFRKEYLGYNTDLGIIVNSCISGLVSYANRKATDFAKLIKTINPSEMNSVINALKEIAEFKVENAKYILQMNEAFSCIDKNRIIEYYSELYIKKMEEFDSLDEKLDYLCETYGDDEELDEIIIAFYNPARDLENLLSFSKALLIRDLCLGFDIKEVRDSLMLCVRSLFYDKKGNFELHSNPKTLENISIAFLDSISGKDYIKDTFNKFSEALNKAKLSIEEYEKKKDSEVQ